MIGVLGQGRTAPGPAVGGREDTRSQRSEWVGIRRRGHASRERSVVLAGQAMTSGGTVISARAIARFSSRSRVKLLIQDGGKRRYSSSLAV